MPSSKHVSPAAMTRLEHSDENDAKNVNAYEWDGTNWVRSQGSSVNYAIRLDDFTTTGVTYVGKAVISASTGSAVWQIQKIDETAGMVITWADGNSNFDNVWGTTGAVAGLSYS